MKQPFWKKALSYLVDIPIESTGSLYNPELYVQLVKGRYQLCTKNAIYSYADKYDNFLDLFKIINLPDDKNAKINVLLLGFGLGSIPFMLEKVFHKDYEYTAIEIDEEVTYLATKYVLDELNSTIHLITANAYSYMELNNQKFDMIAMDVFDSDNVPDIFETEEFLYLLKNALTEDGLIIYNRLYQPRDAKKTDQFYNQTFSTVFKDACAKELEGNKMLMNTSTYLKT